MNQPHQINYLRNGEATLLMNLSCSSACLAILTACLDRISLVWATFYKTKQTQIAKTNKKHNPRFKTSRFHRFTNYLRPILNPLIQLLKRILIHVLHRLFAARHFCYAKTVSQRQREKEGCALVYYMEQSLDGKEKKLCSSTDKRSL